MSVETAMEVKAARSSSSCPAMSLAQAYARYAVIRIVSAERRPRPACDYNVKTDCVPERLGAMVSPEDQGLRR
jgi:hypothetical protein